MNKKKVLITGIKGFVAPYLADYLLEKNFLVYGTYLKNIIPKNDLNKEIQLIPMDITNKQETNKVISMVKPDMVFHLAGFSSVKHSWDEPELCKKINVTGTQNILESLSKIEKKTKILIISSSQVYDFAENSILNENHPIKSSNPYSESRIEQEKLSQTYNQKYKQLEIVISRSFNHIGPGQNEEFVCSDFAKQVALIGKGLQKAEINVGNINVKRDFSDVRDIVKGYYAMLTKGQKGEIYNICSGKSYLISDILNQLISYSNKKIKIVINPKKFRKNDIIEVTGNYSKLKKITGWMPKYTIEKTLKEMYDWWTSKL